MSRSVLQRLKATTEEETRQKNLKQTLKYLYNNILTKAKTSSETSCKFQLQRLDVRGTYVNLGPNALPSDYMNLILDNQGDILSGLRELFPDSTVSIKTECRAADGNFYDVNTFDETLLRFIDRRYDQTFLVVDWS